MTAATSRLRIIGAVTLVMMTAAACADPADGTGTAAPGPAASTLSTWQALWDGRSPSRHAPRASSTPKGKHSKSTPSSTAGPSAAATSTTPDGSPQPTSAAPNSPAGTTSAPARPVHVSLLESDGAVYGIGMPIVAFFDRAPTDATAFERAVKVTVNGAPAGGGWYWERASRSGVAIEAHYRPQHYWPAHAKIAMSAPVKGLSAGSGLAYGNSLSLAMQTGAANVATVDGNTLHMTVTSDGSQVFDFPVSLGAATTPTYNGTKVVMEKDAVQRMVNNPGEPPYDLQVPWSVRLTYSGEFVHAASWNGGNIGAHNTSHGCTNLNESDAQNYFNFSRVGDVLVYRNTGGPQMPSWDGYGDWNLSWSSWQGGGLLK